MPDEGISQEDRERLVKTKFGDLFNEFFDQRFAEAFDKRVKEAYAAGGGKAPDPQQQQQQQQQPTKGRRTSLFDQVFAQALGIGNS